MFLEVSVLNSFWVFIFHFSKNFVLFLEYAVFDVNKIMFFHDILTMRCYCGVMEEQLLSEVEVVGSNPILQEELCNIKTTYLNFALINLSRDNFFLNSKI